MRALIVEDDFANRLLIQTFLSRYGECHVAVNGKEAVDAFRAAVESDQKYDLICMDIMMPEMDGQAAVRAIRELERSAGIFSRGTKIFMTSALRDIKDVATAFEGMCDAYLLKPLDTRKLLGEMKGFGLVS